MPRSSLPLRFYLPLAVIVLVIGGVFIALPVWLAATHLYWGAALAPAAHDYAGSAPASCPTGARSAHPDAADLHTPGGVPIRVRVPQNYDAARPHPLLVVFAPASLGPALNERFTGLTHQATAAGFIVAYAGSRGLTPQTIRDLGRIPDSVSGRYCVDLDRLIYTGHSDGGTVSSALAFLPDLPHHPVAITPSAAGIRGTDLAQQSCPRPLAVMILHGERDRLFPGYGRDAARWWAQCNHDGTEPKAMPDGSLSWPGPAAGAQTRYCPHPGRHLDWPQRNDALLAFARNAIEAARESDERNAATLPSTAAEQYQDTDQGHAQAAGKSAP